MASELNKKFAAMFRGGPRAATATAAAAAFGKLPDYGDHFELPPALPPVIAAIRQVMYVGGIESWGGQWNRLAAEDKVIPFGHTIIHETGNDVTLLRLTPSEDKVGRAGFPLVIGVTISGLPAAVALKVGWPLLVQADAARAALRSREQLQVLVERLEKDLLAGVEAALAQPVPEGGDAAAVARLVADAKLGPDAALLLTVLGSLEDKLKLLDGRRRAVAGEGAVHLRVPATESSGRNSGRTWAELLNAVIDFKTTAFYAIAPDGNQWVDLLVGEPDKKQFGCLRVGLEELPLICVRAAAASGSFADKCRQFLKIPTAPVVAPSPVAKPVDALAGKRVDAVPAVVLAVPAPTATPAAPAKVAVATQAVAGEVSPPPAEPPRTAPPRPITPDQAAKPAALSAPEAAPELAKAKAATLTVAASPKAEPEPAAVVAAPVAKDQGAKLPAAVAIAPVPAPIAAATPSPLPKPESAPAAAPQSPLPTQTPKRETMPQRPALDIPKKRDDTQTPLPTVDFGEDRATPIWHSRRVMAMGLVAILAVAGGLALLLSNPAKHVAVVQSQTSTPVTTQTISVKPVTEPPEEWNSDKQAAQTFHNAVAQAHRDAQRIADAFENPADLRQAMLTALGDADKRDVEVSAVVAAIWPDPLVTTRQTDLKSLYDELLDLNRAAVRLGNLQQAVVAAAKQNLTGRPLGWPDAAAAWKKAVNNSGSVAVLTGDLPVFWRNVSGLDTQRTALAGGVALKPKSDFTNGLAAWWQQHTDNSLKPLLTSCDLDNAAFAGQLTTIADAGNTTVKQLNALPGQMEQATRLVGDSRDKLVDVDALRSLDEAIGAVKLAGLDAKTQNTIDTTLKSLKALATIEKETDADKLAERIRDDPDDSLRIVAWRRWKEVSLDKMPTKTPSDGTTDPDAAVFDALRKRPLPKIDIDDEAVVRWNQRLEAIDNPTDQDLDYVVEQLAKNLGLHEAPVPKAVRSQYNLALRKMKLACKTPGDQLVEQAKAFHNDLASMLPDLLEAGIPALLKGLEAAVVVPKSFEILPKDAFVFSAVPDYWLMFVRIPGDPPCYICTTEFPVGLFCQIREESKKQGKDILDESMLDDLKRSCYGTKRLHDGPYSWRGKADPVDATNATIYCTGPWLDGKGNLIYTRGMDFNSPTATTWSPMQCVTVGVAMKTAQWLGCRLPTSQEWASAARDWHDQSSPNPDKRVADYFDKLIQTQVDPSQWGFHFLDPATVTNWIRDETPPKKLMEQDQASKKPMDLDHASALQLQDMGGNVGEWTYDSQVDADQPIDMKWAKIMGNSVFSKCDENDDKRRSSDPIAAFADVGFRLVSDGPYAEAEKNICRLVKNAHNLWRDGRVH